MGYLRPHTARNAPALVARALVCAIVAGLWLPVAANAAAAGDQLSGFIQVDAGSAHSVALRADGTVWSWGRNDLGQVGDNTNTERRRAVQTEYLSGRPLTNMIQVAAGAHFSMALRADGTVWAWGENVSGGLGDGTTTQRDGAVQVTYLSDSSPVTDMKMISAGSDHAVALRADGTVWSWGENDVGRVGDGTNTDRHGAVQAQCGEAACGGAGTAMTNVTQVSASSSWTTRVLRADGTMWAWGNNSFGQVGDGSTTHRNQARQSDCGVAGCGGAGVGLTNIIQVSGGFEWSMALRADGTVWTFGRNTSGHLGDGTTTSPRTQAVQSTYDAGGNQTNMKHAAGGNLGGTMIRADGTVWAWGGCGSGCNGDGTTNQRNGAVQSQCGQAACGGSGQPLLNIKQVDGGNGHTVSVDASGRIWTYGSNTNGQLGDNSVTQRTRAVAARFDVAAPDLTEAWLQTDGGTGYSVYLRADGTVWAWGNNDDGQLGNNSTTPSSAPVQVECGAAACGGAGTPLTNILQISTRERGVLAVRADGTVWGWGDNTSQQLGDNTFTDRTQAVQATCGVAACGGSPNPLTNFKEVSAGGWHSHGLDASGRVFAWGSNDDGRLGDGTATQRGRAVSTLCNGGNCGAAGTPLINIAQLSAGGIFAAALRADGTAWAWGYGGMGTLGDNGFADRNRAVQVQCGAAACGGAGTALTNVFEMASSGLSVSSIRGDGSVWSWGRNSESGLGDGTSTNRGRAVATTVPGPATLTNATHLAADSNQSHFARDADGTLWAWGANDNGELADGTATERNRAVLATHKATDAAIDGVRIPGDGRRFMTAVLGDGSAVAAGLNTSNELGDCTVLERQRAIPTPRCAPTTYDEAVGYINPAGYWKLGEAAGLTAFDSSGNGIDGTYTGGVTYSRPGANPVSADTAVGFDGSADHVWLGDVWEIKPTEEVTIEGWFKTTGGGASYQMIFRHRWEGFAIAVMNTGIVRTRIYLNNGVVTPYNADSPLAYDDGEWHHAVGTYDGSSIRTYVDGGLVATTPTAGGIVQYSTGGSSIGRDGDADGLYFPGDLDEVAVYGKALGPTEIQEHYALGNPPPAPSDQFTHDTDASTGDTNPTAITHVDPHFSWLNNAGGDVDRQRVQVVNTPLDDVVGLWSFDSDTIDKVGVVGDASLGNGLGYAAGSFGDALGFDGSDDYATLPKFDLTTYTVDFWSRLDACDGSQYETQIIKATAFDQDWTYKLSWDCLGVTHDGLLFEAHASGANDIQITWSTEPPVGEWVHIAAVVDDATKTAYLYANGELRGSDTFSGTIVNDPADYTQLGNENLGGAGANLHGSIDELRISDEAKDADEIAGYYATQAPHNTLMWDSDTLGSGVALGSDCSDGNRCDDILYGATGTATGLVYGDARYYVRSQFRTPASGSDLWSAWSGWDWFETQATTGVDISQCQTGTPDVTEFTPTIPGTPVTTSDDCTISFGAAGDSTELRIYQADRYGDAAIAYPDGTSLESDFSGDGYDHSAFGTALRSRGALGMDSQGRYIVGGGWWNAGNEYDMRLWRALPGGGIDNSFSGDGVQEAPSQSVNEDYITDLVVLPDDSVVAVGPYSENGTTDYGIVKVDEDGVLDPTFGGGDGFASGDLAGQTRTTLTGVARQSDGQLIAVGVSNDGSDRGIVARFRANGTLDTSFGTSGYRILDPEGGTSEMPLIDVAISSDDSIIAAGMRRAGAAHQQVVAKFTPDGALDTTGFGGGDGWAVSNAPQLEDQAYYVVEHADGSIYVGGPASGSTVVASKFDASGVLDASFAGGSVTSPCDCSIWVHEAAIAVLPDGSLLQTTRMPGSGDDMVVYKYLPNGSLDPDFGNDGPGVYRHNLNGNHRPYGMTHGRDGDIVVVGQRNDSNIALWMLEDAGTVPNFAAGATDWDDGAGAFGACLRDARNGAKVDPDTWDEAPGNDCSLVDDSRWNGVPAVPNLAAVVAETTGPGVVGATVDMRFGVRVPTGIDAGTTLMAPLIVEAVSPDI